MRIIRDNSNASWLFAWADPYTTTAGITSADIHIYVDMLGSRERYVK